MLTLIKPTLLNNCDFRVASLDLYGNAAHAPEALISWLAENPQDILFLNACQEFDPVIPYLPSNIKCVFVVHDTHPPYWMPALKHQDSINAIVAVSEAVATKLRQRLNKPKKLILIHNGCAFSDLPKPDAERKNDLIFLGGDNPVKGAYDVIKLWKYLQHQGFSGKLHWLGKVSTSFQEKISQLPRRSNIELHGFVDRELLFSISGTAKVFLMLSRVEAFGMSTIEAMSMGCVPVAWDIDTGTKEIVQSNKTGLFASLGSIPDLASKVRLACDKYEEFQGSVIEHSRSHFNEEVMWSRYQSLIDQISEEQSIVRGLSSQQVEDFQPPVHRFQLFPPRLRAAIRFVIGRSPNLGYWLRDLRGW
jgi:glycosyltransferase involved in cell wall biosynthesis